MKPRCSKQRNHALTLVEVVLVIFVLFVLAAILSPSNGGAKKKAKKMACTSNLKQVGLAEKIWASDHGGKFPFEVVTTNGGTLELNNGRNTWVNFSIMSNELSTPKILFCPADTGRLLPATNFSSGLPGHVSYFIGMQNDSDPQALFSGDDNFEVDGVPVKSGWLELGTNVPISWTMARHEKSGNLLLGDGSVQSTTSHGLRTCWQSTGLATNRLVIP
jgi:type II secretory pathway pseudopilin PulG